MIQNADDVTAEYAVETLAPSVELLYKPSVSVAAKTDLGRVRENNEDKFEFYMPADPATLATRGLVFLVCDGMGGHAAGQIASELACKTFIDVYMHHPASEPETAMLSAVVAANRFVLDNSRAFPDRKGMGTTLSGLILIQNRAYTVQLGDSRIYRLRGGDIEALTVDHTWVNEAIREGVLKPEEAENHPYKHVLTRAVGAEPEVHPEINSIDLAPGDLFLLCSDGLTNHVHDESLGEILSSHGLAEAAWTLIGHALQGGGSDNTTVLLVRVDDILDLAPGPAAV